MATVSIEAELKNQIIEANPLKEILSAYGIHLDPHTGKACCPFHDENTGSFHVYERNPRKAADNDNKDFYKCFGCEERGDVIDFVMKKENISFPEACIRLADRKGIKVPEVNVDPVQEKIKEERTVANRRAWETLQKDEEALDYLYSRGLDDKDIGKWRIGMVPWNYPDKRFAGRIVFGITEVHYNPQKAKTVALAYRAREIKDYAVHGWDLDSEEKVKKAIMPKYRNDSENAAYKKSKLLYGLNEAIKGIRERKFAIIMEGYMDVIMAHKNGLNMSVATCGTSITEDQVQLLRKYTDRVFLWMDNDEAGKNSMFRNLPKFLKEGFKVFIVESKPGADPADLALEGINLTQHIQENSKPAIQLAISKVVDEFDTSINKARTEALEELMPLLEQIQRPAEKANYKSVIEQRLGVRL